MSAEMKQKQAFYTIGGTVQASGGEYLIRCADEELLRLCRESTFAYILTARQMGKSSLMVRTANQLASENIRSVIIDLTHIGTQITPEQWYLGLLAITEEQLTLSTDAVAWWQQRAHLGFTQRLTDFFQKVLLWEIAEPVVVFVDEIDTTLSLDFTDDFYAAIRYLFNARATAPEFKRLSFVLIGVATPGDLIRDPQRTPFNIGQRVDLGDFTDEEATPLAEGLNLPPDEAKQTLGWAMKWTNGHPYLTQRLCLAMADARRPHWTEADVDRLVATTFFGAMSEQDNNLQFVRDMLTKRDPDVYGVLTTYKEIRTGNNRVRDEEQSIIKSHLKLSGIVRREGVTLQMRNRIYESVFDKQWIKRHLAMNERTWFKYVAVKALIAFLILSPFLAIFPWENREKEEQQRNLAKFWNASTAQLVAELNGHSASVWSASYSPDGKYIVTASSDKTARIWNASTAQPIAKLEGHSASVLSASYSPDGKYIVTASSDKTARIWNASTAQLVTELSGHAALIWSASYSPDGKYIATASSDKTARIWNASTAQSVAELKGHSDSVCSVYFSPDGKFIVTASNDGTARIYPQMMFIPFDQLIELVPKLSPRELLPEERKGYLHEPQGKQESK